jgi:hypothetical protein
MPKTSFLDVEIFQALSFDLSRGGKRSNVSVCLQAEGDDLPVRVL